jgi:hypothetical protein
MILAAKRLTPHFFLDQFTQGGGWVAIALVVIAVVVLFVIVLKIKDWMRPKGLAEDSPEKLLLQFRDIHQQGALSADEYKSIRERLIKKSGESDRAGDASRDPSADDSAKRSPATDQ